MILLVQNKAYDMTEGQAEKMRKMASEQVPRGIYAVRKKGILELRKDTFKTRDEMACAISEWNKKGFLVFWRWANG